jgi:hypothetical protein
MRFFSGLRQSRRMIFGLDFAGEVEADSISVGRTRLGQVSLAELPLFPAISSCYLVFALYKPACIGMC